MPRDISGNYTLPSGNPVVNGTLIDVAWANPTMSDVAVQLNNVLTRDGLLGPTAPVKFQSGTAAAPSITFLAETTMGLYRAAAGTLGVATSGVFRGTVNSTGNWLFGLPSAGSTFSAALRTDLGSGFTWTSANKGLRINLSNAGFSAIEGMDGTGAVSIQPLVINGSTLSLQISGVEAIGISAARNVTIPGSTQLFSLTLDTALAATNSLLQFARIAGVDGYIGTIGTAGSIVNGSAIGDMVFRVASRGFRFSVDSGATSNLAIGSAGNIVAAAPSSGVTISATGVANTAAGAFSTGVSVGNAANTNANTLDWYEEGTWTPSIGGTATYFARVGTFTRVGNRVSFECKVDVNALGTGSAVQITGLPYNAGAVGQFSVDGSNLATALVSVSAGIASGTAIIALNGRTVASVSPAAPNVIASFTSITISGNYSI